MQLEELLEFDPPPYEQIRLKGTGIGIEHVIRYHKGGMTPEQIAHSFAYPLPLEQVYGAITYYLHNSEELERYLARIEATGEELRQRIEARPGRQSLRERLKDAIRKKAQVQ